MAVDKETLKTNVVKLRQLTGAGMMACKNALVEAGGDLKDAQELIRRKGLDIAKKKSTREAKEGQIFSYIHGGGKLGVIVEINCETDFTARNEVFQQLGRDIAMHIAAADPRFVLREQVTQSVLDKEREIYREQALQSGKPEKVVDRIVDGKMEKFYSQNVLTEQPFVKDSDKSVGQLVTEAVAAMGENIKIRRFVRFVLGEGLEKRSDDFIDEVRKQAAG